MAGVDAVRTLFPQLKSELAELVAIPSVSAAGYPEETRPALLRAHDAIVRLLRDAGVEELGSLQLPETAPVITGELPVVMAGLALAGVRYDRWIRFMLPLMGLLAVASVVMLATAALLE
jgi:hypothetical protein